jgi:hypothetical protein
MSSVSVGKARSRRKWLSDGWNAANRAGWEAPLYWGRNRDDESGWRVFTEAGMNFPHFWILRIATSVFSKSMHSLAGAAAGFRPRRNVNSLRARSLEPGLLGIRGDCTRQRQPSRMMTSSLEIVGNPTRRRPRPNPASVEYSSQPSSQRKTRRSFR